MKKLGAKMSTYSFVFGFDVSSKERVYKTFVRYVDDDFKAVSYALEWIKMIEDNSRKVGKCAYCKIRKLNHTGKYIKRPYHKVILDMRF